MTDASAVPQTLLAPAKLACLKALSVMMSNGLSKNTLCTSTIAARIFAKLGVPFEVVTGYSQMEGVELSFPHVWLESPGMLITDLAFSEPLRSVMVLGQSFSFNDEARKPFYSETPLFAVAQGLPLDVLSTQAQDLEGYVSRGPAHVRNSMRTVLEEALNESKSLTFTGLAAEIIAGAAVEDNPNLLV
jgi:hypothetical protein